MRAGPASFLIRLHEESAVLYPSTMSTSAQRVTGIGTSGTATSAAHSHAAHSHAANFAASYLWSAKKFAAYGSCGTWSSTR